MIELLENAACLSHAARKWLPLSKSGKPVHPSVLTRWSDRGILASNGKRVFLHTWRCGGQRMTTQKAVEDFLTALNNVSIDRDENPNVAICRARDAGRALEAIGA